jgi:hypothetical protein
MRHALALLVVLAAAWPARAKVAVVSIVDDNDATQRDLVSALVEPVAEKWQMLVPPLASSAWKRCKPDDTGCLRDEAKAAGASHVLVVAVAPLGTRKRVVSAQLFGVDREKPLFDDSAVQPGLQNRPSEVIALGEKLAAVEGPPPVVAVEETPPAPASSFRIGPPLLVAGAAVMAASALAFPLGRTSEDTNTVVIGYGAALGIAGGALALIGAGVTVVESL